MPASFKPSGHQQVIPYLIVSEPDKTISFLKHVFGAAESHVSRDPTGRVMHATLKVGDSAIMLGAASEHWPATPCMVYVYLPDVDAAFQRALDSGAKPVMPPADQFYGDRSGGVLDEQGFQWWMATHVEDVSEEELQRRAQQAMQARAQA